MLLTVHTNDYPMIEYRVLQLMHVVIEWFPASIIVGNEVFHYKIHKNRHDGRTGFMSDKKIADLINAYWLYRTQATPARWIQ
jgi:hypothetical protein